MNIVDSILSLPTDAKDAILRNLLRSADVPGALASFKRGFDGVAKPAAKRSSRKAFVAKKTAMPAAKKAPAKAAAKAKAPKPIGAKPLGGVVTFPGLIGDVAATDGSLAAIAKALGVPKPKAAAALKRALKAGDVFMAGARRFARYGTSVEQAKQRAAVASVKPAAATKTTRKPSVAKAHVLNGAAAVN